MLSKRNTKKIARWINYYSLAFYYDDPSMAIIAELDMLHLDIDCLLTYSIIKLFNHENQQPTPLHPERI